MAEAGLALVPGTDDPTIFGTSMGHCWRTLFADLGWAPAEARRFALAGVDACWLPEDRRSALRAAVMRDLDALDGDLAGADRTLDLNVFRR